MKQINYKKLILPNIPYVFFVYLFDKVGQAVRLAPGADISAKILNITQGFSAAFENALPSVYPLDLLVGIVGAVIIRLIVYVKGKNAKKYRKGAEYGSARWGNAEDIKPYIDPDFQNNIILTQTERLTMNSRPKQPKYARNKNVVVIGGSGSGKTRFFVKPNLMQLHSSYVLTDPKGTVLIECGKLLQRAGYRIKVLNGRAGEGQTGSFRFCSCLWQVPAPISGQLLWSQNWSAGSNSLLSHSRYRVSSPHF